MSFAKVNLPLLFCDNMVLQQNAEANFWGKANPFEKVSVLPSWQKKTYSVVADQTGNWQLKIKTFNASFEKQTISIVGENKIILSNVLIGEVWFSSGQSNIELPMRRVSNAEKEIKEATYPNIRLFNVKKKNLTNQKPKFQLVLNGWNVLQKVSKNFQQ